MRSSRVVCMQCHNACRVLATVDGETLVSVEADPEFPGARSSLPVTQGCPRRRAVLEYNDHPARLRFPLKRAGARGGDRWQQVSWDEALTEIAGRLSELTARYGPETVATSSGTGRTHDETRQRFMNLLGSPNHVGAGAICYGPMCVVGHALFGWRVFPVVRSNTQCVLLWGGGGPRYWDVFWRAARRARQERGAKIIVIDPRQSDTAKDADLWLQIRPGTDCALALGMINHILEQGLYDRAFVGQWCEGLESLRVRAAEYPLARVAEITWVPAEKIRQAAEWYATLKPAATNHGMGVEHLGNVIETLHAHYLLSALCGYLEEPGGDVFPKPYPGIVHEQQIAAHERLAPAQIAKTLGGDRFRLMTREGYDALQANVSRVYGNEAYNRTSYEVYAHAPSVYRAMLDGKPYPVKAMLTLSSNPMVTEPNTHLVHEALKKLDLYVVMDFFKTPSAQLADYVLPATTYLERPWLWTYSGVVGSERALPKTLADSYDRRDDYDFWRGLGLRLGQKDDWPWETLEDLYDYRLAPIGLTFAQFMAEGGFLPPPKEDRRYLRTGFATPSGKVELSSSILAQLGYDPLPEFREPAESPYSRPDVAAEFPLILTTGGRMQPYYHSEHRQVASLRAKRPDPIVQVNPETAAPLGIEDGMWIWIETPRGRIQQRCRLYEGIDARVVHVEHGWWFPEDEGAEPSLHGVWRSNCNVLTDDDPDICNPISGGYPLRGMLCRVYPAVGGQGDEEADRQLEGMRAMVSSTERDVPIIGRDALITERDALIVVDVQNDFVEGGALGVNGGRDVIPVVNNLLGLFRHVVLTRDWHPPNHISFSRDPEYRDGSWPAHAVRDSEGAEFAAGLDVPGDAFVVSKGRASDREEYSGFQAEEQDLAGWLRGRGVLRVFITGIATDYCVRSTALDAAAAGFEVVVVEDAVRGVSAETTARAWAELAAAGVQRASSGDLRPATRAGRTEDHD